jgi:cysteine desulfurase / selenocysteine lyase
MSTNITSTNNGSSNGASRPKAGTRKSAAAPGEARQFPFATFPLPDPATLETLANEFFRAMPRDLADGDGATPTSPEAESDEIPVTMFEGTLPVQETSVEESASGIPASSLYTEPGPLTETDLRAIAASLAGSTALVPGAPGTAPQPPVAGSPPDFLAEAKQSPFTVAPTLPPATEMFSFPAGSAMPVSPPTAPPSAADASTIPQSPASSPVFPGSTPYYVEGEKGTSPAASPVLPPVNELFSFPRIPAMPAVPGIETTPKPPAPPSSPSAMPPGAADGSAAPAQGHDVKGITPEDPAIAPGHKAVSPGSSTSLGETVGPDAASSIPSWSDFFSFPGVPGVQSPPGIPTLTSVPSTVPAEADPQKANPPSSVPTSGNVPKAETVTPDKGKPGGTPAAVPGAGAFEFQPDLAPAELGIAKRPLDAKLIRRDFPILEERVHGRPLIWLDNAATTQKPNAVIERLSSFYRHENSNIHRAAHELAARATDAYESAREKSRRFLNASSTREIIFVRGATEGINLVAQSWGRRNVREGDEIVITWLEHHANIVPWQMLCSEKGARLRVAPVNDRGEIILEEYEKLLGPRTRIVSFSQVSNALGTITPAREMVEMAHRYGARVLVDGAQSVSHMPVDVQTLDYDFFVFSGHKVFGPTGIGVVYGKLDLLESMPPWQGGGNMIADVTFEKTTYQGSPARFEAGTGNIADAVGLGAALDYVDEIGRENIAAYEHDLLNYGTEKLLTVPGLRLVGTAREKAGVLSFVIDEVRSEDVGVALNQEGIAVRAGHHCAQPILRRMGVESTVRPSLAFYNTCEDIDALVAVLWRLQAGRGHRKL